MAMKLGRDPQTRLFAAVALGAIFAAPLAISQTQPDPDAVQREIEDKAIRLPANPLTAALSTRREDGSRRIERPQLIARRPDFTELRATLRRSDTESSEGPSPSPASRPVPRGIDRITSERLATRERIEIDRVFVPLLLPADPALVDKFTVYGMNNIYTASAAIDASASISITGTCYRVVGGDPDMTARRARTAASSRRLLAIDAPYEISRNQSGTDLSFSRFGCGYVLTLECDDPEANERCAGEDYITALASSLIIANPAIAEGEQ